MATEKDDFWDLGKPREKKYAKPGFSSHSVGTTEITDEGDVRAEETRGEKIGKRDTFTERDDKTNAVSSSFWMDPIGGKRIVTSSYRRRTVHTDRNSVNKEYNGEKSVDKILNTYIPDGKLIKKIEVKNWTNGSDFYGRFSSDALQSYKSHPSSSYFEKMESVPFNSFVPQYAHMNMAQIEFFRWLRENIRNGFYPDCDYAYIQLLIFEVINLPGEIDASEAVTLLEKIWLGYRERYPRIDSCLAEWMADFCMINAIKLPDSLLGIVPEITSKVQFKEFYIDAALRGENNSLGAVFAYAISDYDYSCSRYYDANRQLYDLHINAAIEFVARTMLEKRQGIFALEKIYKMTKDSFCGAIVASNIKRRLDIEFCSVSRSAEAREVATNLVKYAENKVRQIAGIKAKLTVGNLGDEYTSLADAYFSPFVRTKSVNPEDRYMPDDYLKNYEADTVGFDLDAAEEIEKNSWVNTERLTGEEYVSDSLAEERGVEVEGAISSYEGFEVRSEEESTAAVDEPQTGSELAEGVIAALEGRFAEYSRKNGIFEGDLADRINTLMLDVIGDVVLENDGTAYKLIEDYREDMEEWIKSQD